MTPSMPPGPGPGREVHGWGTAFGSVWAVSLDWAPRRRLVTIDPDASLRDAARVMRSEDVSALVVGTPNQRVSVVTERDVTHAVADGTSPDVAVGTVASGDPATVDVGATVMTAASTMLQLGVRHLVVVDRHRAVGIVSMRDLMAEFVLPRDLPGALL